MPTFQSSEDLDAWKLGRGLCREVYALTKQGDFSKDFVLRDQIRRASVSILSNISEGFERSGTSEFVQFLSIAKGSAGELKAQLCIALDQGYIDQPAYQRLSSMAIRTGQVIGGLMSYLRSSNIKGSKFK